LSADSGYHRARSHRLATHRSSIRGASMSRMVVALLVGLALCLTSAVPLRGADAVTITYPYLGVTHITRVGSPPEFPRNVKIHVVTLDLTVPSEIPRIFAISAWGIP